MTGDHLDQLAIVIPYRAADAWRERLFQWTLARYKMILPEAEIVVGFDSSGGYFNRAEAINNGVRKATRPLLLIADADVIAFREPVALGCIALVECSDLVGGKAQWVLPYDNYNHLDAVVTGTLLAAPPGDDPRKQHLVPTAQYPDSTSGLVMISRDNFETVGGFDERFVGWGPEDQAFADALRTLVGGALRVAVEDLYHMWHPVTPGTRTDNPHYPTSCALWDRYKAAFGNAVAMHQLVREAP